MQDEEVDFFLTNEGNSIYRAAAAACRLLADPRQSNRSIGDLSIGDQNTDYLELANKYEAIAAANTSPWAGGISIADKQTREADTDRVQPSFSRTLHDTPGQLNPTPRTS